MTSARLLLAYDGARFAGFQAQPGQRTVQGVLQDALGRLAGAPVPVAGAGRTDAGVHAIGQVATARRPRDLEDESLLRALGGALPSDVSVLDCAQAPPGFDPRRDAISREYAYLLWDHPARHPFLSRISLHTARRLDHERLDGELRSLVGTHDFTSLARVREDQSSERTVLDASAERVGNLVVIRVSAVSFLHQMVRSIVGTALEVASGRREPGWSREVLAARDRAAAGPVAPPHGLALVDVAYDSVVWTRRPEAAWPWGAAGGFGGAEPPQPDRACLGRSCSTKAEPSGLVNR
jgi:tRNA pseudouridine38-40 synthase